MEDFYVNLLTETEDMNLEAIIHNCSSTPKPGNKVFGEILRNGKYLTELILRVVIPKKMQST
jgi:hypothetical protein